MPSLFTLCRPLAALTLLSSGLLGGCTTASYYAIDNITRLVSVYKIDVVQGNVITKEQLALVKPGKSRSEVRDVLGTPLLADPFHAQRWDYAFTLRREDKTLQRRDVVIWFDGDVVKQIEAPELPSEREFVASINPDSGKTSAPEPKLALTQAERAALPKPALTAPVVSAPQGATRSYPPLEPL
jgi:outer membrane protein assembly factor BamE